MSRMYFLGMLGLAQILLASAVPAVRAAERREEAPPQSARPPQPVTREESQIETTPNESVIIPANQDPLAFLQPFTAARGSRMGLTISLFQHFSSNIVGSSESSGSSAVSALSPRVFATRVGRKDRLHAEYQIGYRHYGGRSDFNSLDHHAGVDYDYEVNRTSSFRLSNRFSSSQNDIGSMGTVVNLEGNPTFESNVLFERQRITTNYLSGAWNQHLGRRTRVTATSSFSTYRFGQRDFGDGSGAEIGVTFEYRLTRRLTISNGYASYFSRFNRSSLNRVDRRLLNSYMHRIPIGGMNFKLGRKWNAYLSGGVEIADLFGTRQTGASLNARVSKGSSRNRVTLSYQRGFTAALGLAQVFQSDIWSASWAYRWTRRTGFQLSTSYYRSSSSLFARSTSQEGGSLESMYANAGMHFLLKRYIKASVNYSYQIQRARDFSFEQLDLSRYVVFATMNYTLPLPWR